MKRKFKVSGWADDDGQIPKVIDLRGIRQIASLYTKSSLLFGKQSAALTSTVGVHLGDKYGVNIGAGGLLVHNEKTSVIPCFEVGFYASWFHLDLLFGPQEQGAVTLSLLYPF
ncbi:MAG: hypothetical protein H6765_06390 [Candidatus Peribacteria bacterium]|nr:MAG: hypothetical protein H6765_06390 [Candidatus Peribacteria bacterium]